MFFCYLVFSNSRASLMAIWKEPALSMQVMQETWVPFLRQKDSLQKEMTAHLIFLPGKSHRQKSLAGYSPWGCKRLNSKNNMTAYLYSLYFFSPHTCCLSSSTQHHRCYNTNNKTLQLNIQLSHSINILHTFINFILVAQLVKNLPAMQKTPIRFLDQEDPREKGMPTHSSILACVWNSVPMGWQRVRHD